MKFALIILQSGLCHNGYCTTCEFQEQRFITLVIYVDTLTGDNQFLELYQ